MWKKACSHRPHFVICRPQTKKEWHPEPHSTSAIIELNERRRRRRGRRIKGGMNATKEKKFEMTQNRSYMHLVEPNIAQ